MSIIVPLAFRQLPAARPFRLRPARLAALSTHDPTKPSVRQRSPISVFTAKEQTP